MKPVAVVLVLSACLAVGWFVYRDSVSRVEAKSTASPPPSLAVQVMKVQRRRMEERVDLVGSLEANSTVTIRAKTTGYVTRLPFDVGDRIKAGELLVELDTTRHQELVSRAQAALKVSKAQLRAQETRRSQAAKELDRQNLLAKSRVSTAEQQEAAAASLSIANAEFDLEQARVDQAESDLLRSQLSLDETRVIAPMEGFVAARMVDSGDLADAAKDLLQIVDLSKVRTVVHIVEKDYEKIQQGIGQTATVRVDAFPNETFRGVVVRKAPILDPQTRTAAVQIEIPNPRLLLKPGMHARVSVVYSVHNDAEVIPLASLVEHGEKPALYVVEGNPPTTVLHEVQTGLTDGDMVEILSGLDDDDRVVTLGTRLIQHGQKVTPVEVPAEVLVQSRPSGHGAE